MTEPPTLSALARLPRVALPFVELLSRSFGFVLDRDGSSGYENRLRGLVWGMFIGRRGLRVGRGVRAVRRSRIYIGDDVTLYGDLYLDASSSSGELTIGARTHIDRGCILYGQGGLAIGSGSAIAARCTIYTQSSQYNAGAGLSIAEQGTRYAPVSIGDDVWLGAAVSVVPGVTIGDRAVVGAGAVVTTSVLGGDVVAGVPARPIAKRDN